MSTPLLPPLPRGRPVGKELEAVVSRLVGERGADVRCVVLTGAGKAFSAGGDLKWLNERHTDQPRYNRSGARGALHSAAGGDASRVVVVITTMMMIMMMIMMIMMIGFGTEPPALCPLCRAAR
jgi:enoyl-CoA hydratase/carnithine racemase